jgi:MFS family permease
MQVAPGSAERSAGWPLFYLQLTIALAFATNTFCYGIGDAWLPEYLSKRGYAGKASTLPIKLYGISTIIGGVIFLLLYVLSIITRTTKASRYWTVLLGLALALAGTVMVTALPESYGMLMAARCLQGTGSVMNLTYLLVWMPDIAPPDRLTSLSAYMSIGERQMQPHPSNLATFGGLHAD